MSLRKDILHHFYKEISTSIFLLLSPHTSLRSEFLQPSLLVPLRSEILQSSVLTSLQSKFVLVSLWKLFLGRLYKDTFTVTTIPSKPEMIVQGIQVKLETPKTWLHLYSSLHSYSKLFYKFVPYYMFDNNYNIDTWNIRRKSKDISCHWRKNKEWNSRQITVRMINIISCLTTYWHQVLICFTIEYSQKMWCVAYNWMQL